MVRYFLVSTSLRLSVTSGPHASNPSPQSKRSATGAREDFSFPGQQRGTSSRGTPDWDQKGSANLVVLVPEVIIASVSSSRAVRCIREVTAHVSCIPLAARILGTIVVIEVFHRTLW
jgi:hypothetical protein